MTGLTTNDQSDREYGKGSYRDMDMTPDTAAPIRVCCMAQQKVREDEQDIEKCGWTTSQRLNMDVDDLLDSTQDRTQW